MPLKYMKRCTSVLLIRQTQNTTTPGYYFSSLRLAKMKMNPCSTLVECPYFWQFDNRHSMTNVLVYANLKGFWEFINIYKDAWLFRKWCLHKSGLLNKNCTGKSGGFIKLDGGKTVFLFSLKNNWNLSFPFIMKVGKKP